MAGDKTKIARYQQSIAANGTQGLFEAMQQDHAFFISDSFKLRRGLTVNAGFRWDFQLNSQPHTTNPALPSLTGYIPHDLKMRQPRLGLAWNIGGRDSTVLRVSSGIFTARTPAYLMQRVFTDNGLNTLVLDSNTDPSILQYLTVPNRIKALPAGVRTPINAVYAFDPRFRNPRSGQVAIALEQRITRDTKVAISFTRNSTWNLQRRLQFTANYTYATNRDDDTNERDFNRQNALYTYNLTYDAAYAKNDIRHNGNFHALYNLGRGFTVSTLLFARTGIPVKPVVGADTQNDGNTVNDRPVINGRVAARDAFRQPGFFDWDARLLKQFRLGDSARVTFSFEVFNVTRSTNKTFNGDGETTFGAPRATPNPFTGLPFANNTATIPTFAPGTDRFGGPRQAQLGVRFLF